MKPKTKIVTLEGVSEISNKDLAWLVEQAITTHLADSDFTLTQKVSVRVAQGPESYEKQPGYFHSIKRS